MEQLIELSQVSKYYGTIKAVDAISFKLQRGSVLGVLGPNGAGKSTTMKMITGFLTPDAGKIQVAQYDVTTHPIEVKQHIGYLPEGAPAYPDMTPWTFLNFVADIRGLKRQTKKSALARVIDEVHLNGVCHQPIATLSKGYKRRVGLAQALIHNPPILILDEPTDGLDPNQKFEVRNLIKQMASQKAIILSTHILEEVDALCDRTLIIAGGKIVADSTPECLKAHSKDHNALIVGIHTHNALDLKQVLSELPLADKIELLDEIADISYYRIPAMNNRALFSEVSELCQNQPWSLHSLRIDEGRLEEVFRDFTISEQARN